MTSADSLRAQIEILQAQLAVIAPAPWQEPEIVEDVCAGCWRDKPLTMHEKVGLGLCDQCRVVIDSLFLYGDGSESANHARRLIVAYKSQSERRQIYAADLRSTGAKRP